MVLPFFIDLSKAFDTVILCSYKGYAVLAVMDRLVIGFRIICLRDINV